MAQGFINISVSGNGDVAYYGRDEECLYIESSSNLSKEKKALLQDWKRIEQQEKIGDKSLGIRGRHDAQVRKNYVLSLPNELSPAVASSRIVRILEQTPIKDCSYSIFIHRGAKDGIVNQHAHVIVNERNLQTMKKDRDMIKPDFLKDTFRPLYVREFEQERSQGVNYERRERLDSSWYYVDADLSRSSIQEQHSERGLNQSGTDLFNLLASYDVAVQERERQKEEALRELAEKNKLNQEVVKTIEPEPSRSRGFGMGM